MMATVIRTDGSEDITWNFAEVASADWSQIDRVELTGYGRVLESHSPAEFWEHVRVLAGVV